MIYRLLISWAWLLCIFLWFWARLIRVGLRRTREGMSETPARWGKPWLGVSIFFTQDLFLRADSQRGDDDGENDV
jgi:hypothetical protein